MLPAGARLRRRSEFAATLRAGRGRAGGSSPALLVVHLSVGSTDGDAAVGVTGRPRAGFVVSRAVGGAVVRNRVRRRLRHLVAARLQSFPPGSRLVVRALPAAAAATGAQLEAALESALQARAPRAGQDRRP